MPSLGPVYTEVFYSPLTEDVEELLAHFQQSDSVRYDVFSAIWREMSFSDLFLGITSIAEMKRFCRIALATAMKYFMPPYSYQIRVGGLYLIFAFYNAQLAIPPVNLRLPLRDWDQVQKFLKESVIAGHYDVVYVYRKLISTKAIHYVAMPHFLAFQKQRKPNRERVCAEFLGRTTAVQDLLSTNILDEISNIQGHYEKLKEATVEVGSKVIMTQRDFSSRLEDCMLEFITWQQKAFAQSDTGKDECSTSSSTRARLLSSIKNKSYNTYQEAPKSRRHRHVETVDSSSSGVEQTQETVTVRKKRPPSLRARTTKSLTVVQDESRLNAWLLSAPEKQ